MLDDLKIVAFLGSPRKDGNTELLLRETVRGIERSGIRVETFNLNLMKIRPCQDCGGCKETGRCVIDDDMSEIYGAIREADRIIVASPIFFSGLSAQTKIMIDRCQNFYCEKYLLGKPIKEGKYGRKGLLLLVGGQKKGVGAKCSEVTAEIFLKTISVSERKTFSFLGIDGKGAVLKHPEALKRAFEAGKEFAIKKI